MSSTSVHAITKIKNGGRRVEVYGVGVNGRRLRLQNKCPNTYNIIALQTAVFRAFRGSPNSKLIKGTGYKIYLERGV